MTREEIIHEYEDAVAAHAVAAAAGIKGAEKSYELFKAGLEALRPVSREQVEKLRGEWESTGAISCQCSKCKCLESKSRAKEYSYCPCCGAPMTDEAVEMVMERMEAISE